MSRGAVGGSGISQSVLDALAQAQTLATAAMRKADAAATTAGTAAQTASSASQAASTATQAASSASQAAGTASQTATSAAQVAEDLRAAVASAETAHAAIIAAGVEQLEAATVPIPAMVLVLGTATVDVSVTWDNAFPSDTYLLGKPKLLTSSATVLGKVTAVLKSQSKTGCVITVTTSAAVSVGTTSLLVLAYRKGAN